ncbi:MAG: ABC1 kinase family protein, partial [Thermoplasmatota archaeon]
MAQEMRDAEADLSRVTRSEEEEAAFVRVESGANGNGHAEPPAPRPAVAPSVFSEGAPKALTKASRTVEILRILYRNDFFGMMRELASAERAPGPRGGMVEIPRDMPRKTRKILEELGPTFVKIGQLLGTRPDLVPKPFVDEFRNLYDRTTPSDFDLVKAQIEKELGRPLDEVFLEFAEIPVASASVGQVHFATLRTGERVAVKVQHPGIEERVYLDFEILEPMVRFIENLFAASRVWQPREHFREVFEMLARELDYRYEARNHQRVYESFKDDPSVKIPKIYWEYSAKRVLTLERIEGVKLSDFENPDLKALDGKSIARIITQAMAKQIFEDRLFHADPSPGNLMAMSSEVVAFLDFGAVGRVTRRRGERILQLISGLARGDLETVTVSLVEICNTRTEVDRKNLARDVERVMDYYERER